MTTELKDRRKRWAGWSVAGALAACAVAFTTLAIEWRSLSPEATLGPAAPEFDAASAARTQRILVTSKTEAFTMVRGPNGAWILPERGGYPIAPAQMQAFSEALDQLTLTARLTRDPDKHARLGVDDPRQGGAGLLIQLEDGQGARIVDLILGEKGPDLFVRRSEDPQVWAVSAKPGDFPLLPRAADWLDIAPLPQLAAEHPVVRVLITPPDGSAPYALSRPDAGAASAAAGFALEPPHEARTLSGPTAAAATASALAGLDPEDVAPAPAVQGQVRGRVQAFTADGLQIDAELYQADGRSWLKLVARAAQPEAQAKADQLNARVAGWTYALSPQDLARLAPPLDALAPPPTVPGEP